MLCLRCGKKEQYADNLCEECIRETVIPVSLPQVVQAVLCRNCKRLQRGRSWTDPKGSPEDAAVEAARMALKTDDATVRPKVDLFVENGEGSLFRISGKATSVYRGLMIEQELFCEVRLHPQTCPWCSRQMGNYFEAILQLRGTDTLTDTELDRLLGKIREETYMASLKDPDVFITKEEKVRGGYDFYMGHNGFAKQLHLELNEDYGGEKKWSSSLFGRKDGRDVYRYTYLVRLPGFALHDYLITPEGPSMVRKISKKVQLVRLSDHGEFSVEQSEAMKYQVEKAKDVEVDLVKIMETEKELQVLHPRTLRPSDIIKPPGYSIVNGKIKGVLIQNELYLSPFTD